MKSVEDTIEMRNSRSDDEYEDEQEELTPQNFVNPGVLNAMRRHLHEEEEEEEIPQKEQQQEEEELPTDLPPQVPTRKASTPATLIPQPRPVMQQKPQELPEDTREHLEDYPLPPYDLLCYVPPSEDNLQQIEQESLQMQQRIINIMTQFRITLGAGDITRGPSITRYEFYPPEGLKLLDLPRYLPNLKLGTKANSINLLAPVPGKDTIAIELENTTKSPVFLRELLQSEAFHSPKLRIPVALGKDVYGKPIIGDLAAMPHTLVAGTTGSGKSVCINSMILSMLYKFRPDELKLVLVDPKVVEMQPYKKLPHLACPVVTTANRVIGALRWAVNEMEHRYSLFSRVGVRNFEDFNNRPEDFEPAPDEEMTPRTPVLPDNFNAAHAIARDDDDYDDYDNEENEEIQGELNFDDDEQIPTKLPYIVIIIDELADLMMQVKEDLEYCIARLTQKARAAGIHLVAATQTPRATTITGMIKANIPSRLAFKVAGPLDSRVILDINGAENLLGKGDFLFLPPEGVTQLRRAQGAFVSDDEIRKIVKFCAAHAKQNFVSSINAEMDSMENASKGGDGGGQGDGSGMSENNTELYARCVQLVITEQKASTSMLQRRFSIGYGRAAKMMDEMEKNGVIGPASSNTARPREVLISADSL